MRLDPGQWEDGERRKREAQERVGQRAVANPTLEPAGERAAAPADQGGRRVDVGQERPEENQRHDRGVSAMPRTVPAAIVNTSPNVA